MELTKTSCSLTEKIILLLVFVSCKNQKKKKKRLVRDAVTMVNGRGKNCIGGIALKVTF